MTNSKGQEIFNLVGTVLRKFAPEKKGKYTISKFQLQTTDGKTVYISSFKALNIEVGADVEFQATRYNETNYTVQSEIKSATKQVNEAVETFNQPSTEATPTTTTRRRGRPSASKAVEEAVAVINKTEAVTTSKVPVDVPITGRELHRGEAEKGAYINLQSAIRVLEQLNLKGTVADLVAVADLIGRTQTAIFMDSKKDERMSNFRK